ncbi:hypothetical protein PsAD2_02870 [Pseudovibrio axinellae]|uniref:Flagellar assembly protein H n=1 Tax=Pseudovibrio axinellae TaxID=989403 RepID=A0A165XIZ9_9HYPH|nr:hypothetical protein [Pseudovibrio axinellae]KZL17753.1 hypothetical protein PsAD2_02870 [Pseudovibrio axinellae]SEP74002.1 hypothetical protein SAMN05421798_101280 [Pseudovibrio axinellae]
MTRGINDCLADFTQDTGVTTKDLQDMQEVISMLPKGYGEGGDWVNRVFEAYENGFSEGEEAAKAGADERIKKMREELEVELAAREKAFKEGEGERLKQAFQQSLVEIEETLSKTVSQTLVPFIEENARERAVGSLVQVLRRQLSESSEAIIKVSGPQYLFDLFGEKAGDLANTITFSENSSADLELKVSDMTLSTGLTEWCDELRNTLGE